MMGDWIDTNDGMKMAFRNRAFPAFDLSFMIGVQMLHSG